jgi:hypothetical protein
MFFKPDHIMSFGANKGYSLAEIYKYLPDYIEWLVEYIPEFEINLVDFENLPKPTIFYDPIELETNKGKIIISPRTTHKGSIDSIKKKGKFKEIDFKFSQKTKNILLQKEVGIYEGKEYKKRNDLH